MLPLTLNERQPLCPGRIISTLMLMKTGTQEFLDHAIALLHQALALGVSRSAIHNCDLPWPLLYQGVNDVIDKLLSVVGMLDSGCTQEGKDLILNILANLCS